MTSRRRGPPARPRAPAGAWNELYPSLDLHGETAQTARNRTDRWLRERQEESISTVRVITGRGAHSAGPPVLRGEIEDLLRILRGTVVSSFVAEAGGGAFRIELRRIKRTARSGGATLPGDQSKISLRDLDPELRRRAEESLWDLGVDPTPALIRAEVRRLQREQEAP